LPKSGQNARTLIEGDRRARPLSSTSSTSDLEAVKNPLAKIRSGEEEMTEYATELLKRQLADLNKNPIDLVSVGLTDESNVYDWEILIMGPDGTLYEGGFFKARLVFPPDFPNMPPTMTFVSDMWHPNVYEDGKVCISILHPPGEDEMNAQESADERWRPILGVEQILMSVVSMLSDPNDESPANLDAAVQWRNDRAGFKKKVRQVVRKSQEMC